MVVTFAAEARLVIVMHKGMAMGVAKVIATEVDGGKQPHVIAAEKPEDRTSDQGIRSEAPGKRSEAPKHKAPTLMSEPEANKKKKMVLPAKLRAFHKALSVATRTKTHYHSLWARR